MHYYFSTLSEQSDLLHQEGYSFGHKTMFIIKKYVCHSTIINLFIFTCKFHHNILTIITYAHRSAIIDPTAESPLTFFDLGRCPPQSGPMWLYLFNIVYVHENTFYTIR